MKTKRKLYGIKVDGTVARRLAIAMQAAGLGVMDTAAHAMVSPSGVSNYVNNKAIPSRRTATRIATVLGVSVEWLLGITGTDAVDDGKNRLERPDALLTMYQRLSESSRRYLLETAALLQFRDESARG